MRAYLPTRTEETLARQLDDAREHVARVRALIRREALTQLRHSAITLDSLLPTPRGNGYYVECFLQGYAHGHHGGATGEGQDYRVQKDSAYLPVFAIEGLGALCGRAGAAEELCCGAVTPAQSIAAERKRLMAYLAEEAVVPPARERALARASFLEQARAALEHMHRLIGVWIETLARDRDLLRAARFVDDLAESFGEGARLGFARRRLSAQAAMDLPRTPDALLRLFGALDGMCAAMVVITGGDVAGNPVDEVTTGHVARAARAAARAALTRGWEGKGGRLAVGATPEPLSMAMLSAPLTAAPARRESLLIA